MDSSANRGGSVPKHQRPWRVFTRSDSGYWQVQWGGRDAPREALDVHADHPRSEAETEAASRWVARGGKLTKWKAGPLAKLELAELIPLYVESVETTYRGKDGRY